MRALGGLACDKSAGETRRGRNASHLRAQPSRKHDEREKETGEKREVLTGDNDRWSKESVEAGRKEFPQRCFNAGSDVVEY